MFYYSKCYLRYSQPLMSIKFETIEQIILPRLKKELNPLLIYHNIEHTLDVLDKALLIAKKEGIKDKKQLLLLKTAALYHDSGFIFIYKNHEDKGCEIVRKDLAEFFTPDELNCICGMIMATKIPQTPHSHLEKIICDEDLDYLGRDDFEPISKNLYKEFIDFDILKKEVVWDRVQISFFESHHYFTQTSISLRQQMKSKHLQILKQRMEL